jgi:response regulator RpfG family c-di-GMP phosphodiesterase
VNATDMERTDFVSSRTEPEPVLVVDDEHGVRDLMARWLRLSGYSIVAAATADEAIERVQRDSIGVALVDIHMPGHDGHWLTEQLRRRSPDIAVIMVTGLLDVSAACASLQHGVIDYLVKPFGRDRLREAVQRGFDWRRTAMHERKWREELDSETERLRRNLSEAFAALNIDSYDSLDAVLQMLTLRERDLYDHAHRVEVLATRLADALGWAQIAREPLRRAALLHDIGRLALPPVLFRKTGPLSADEQVLVREGPHFAYELLRCSPFLADAADIVRHRYERFDGRGFPGGLSGDVIPASSRILAVVDSYDTMLLSRPYRDAISSTEALLELRRCSGREFDPRIVQAFADVLNAQAH